MPEIADGEIEGVTVRLGESRWRSVDKHIRDLNQALDTAIEALLERERELLELKGPCSSSGCRLHSAHAGPCDIEATRQSE